MFIFGRRLAAVAATVTLGTLSLVGMALPATASPIVDQDRVDVVGKIDYRLNRLSAISNSASKTFELTAAQADGLQLTSAAAIAGLGELRADVQSLTTVDEIEADRTVMISYRINQVVAPRALFVIRGMRMARWMQTSATTLRAAKSHTNHTADVALERAARRLLIARTNVVNAVNAAYRVSSQSAVTGATPFVQANSDWAAAMTALGQARSYLDAAQKADKTSPADTVIRAALLKPTTPTTDAPY